MKNIIKNKLFKIIFLAGYFIPYFCAGQEKILISEKRYFELVSTEQKFTALKSDLDSLGRLCKAADQTIQKLKQKNQKDSINIAKLQLDSVRLSENVNYLNQKIGLLHQDSIKQAAKINNLTQLASKSHNDELKTKLDAALEKEKNLQNQLEALKGQNKSLNAWLSRIKQDSINLSQNLGNFQGQLSQAQTQIRDKDEKLREKADSIKNMAPKVLNYDKVKTQNGKLLKEKNDEIKSHFQTFLDTSSLKNPVSVNFLRAALNKIQSEIKDYREVAGSPEIDAVDSRITRMNEALNAFEKGYQQLDSDFDANSVNNAAQTINNILSNIPQKWNPEATRIKTLLESYCLKYKDARKFEENVDDGGFNDEGKRNYIKDRKYRFDGYPFILIELDKKFQNLRYSCNFKQPTTTCN